MRKRVNQALALSMTAAMLLFNAMPGMAAWAAATGDATGDLLISPAPGSELTIVEGSNGTVVEADEQLATVTLRNDQDEDVTISEYNLGSESQITIAAGETLTISATDIYASDGDAYKLAIVADGVEVSPESGTVYGSEITVAIVEGVLDYYESHGQETARWISCAVYADENGVDPVHSILPMAEGVSEGDTSIDGVSITSNNDNTAAIRSGGSGTLDVTDADINLVGNGGDDFTGIGSALGAADTSTLNVSDTNIYTEGILRSAIFAGDEATLSFTDSSLDCEPGEYQADVSISTAGMASPPNGLGIWGNCRAMNLVGSATVNIEGCEIVSQNWGALGVDDVTDGHLNVSDSNIVIEDQGYGAYSIGKCVDVFDNCTFEIEYGVIAYAAAGDGAEVILQNGSEANSLNYYGFVTHQSFNGTNSKITVTGEGTKLAAGLGGIIAKGRGADIEISDGAVVTAESGVLVRAQINDDTGAGSMDGTEVVNVSISDTELTGDIVQGMGAPYDTESGDASSDASGSAMGPGGGSSAVTESEMNVTLSGATLTGAISSATLTLAIDDGNISMENITNVGVITDTVYESNENAKLNVNLENGAVWNVTEPSYLMSLTIDDTSAINDGDVYVDGKKITPEAGTTYTGEIVVAGEGYKPAGSFPVIPVIIGAVVVVAAAGGFFMIKKK